VVRIRSGKPVPARLGKWNARENLIFEFDRTSSCIDT